MRTLALTALLAAAPASAQRLKGFEGQFIKPSDAGAKLVEGWVGATALVAEAAAKSGESLSAVGYMVMLPFLPMALSLEMPPKDMHEHRLRASVHHIDDRVRGWGGEYRYTRENHLAFESFWSAYLEEGATYDLHYIGARALGDIAEWERGSLEYGFGVAGLAGRNHRGGPNISLGGELRPWRRFFFLDAHAGAVILEGGTLGDLRAGAGLRWRRAEVRAGYKVLAGPFTPLGGPELSLAVRL